jgi:DnaJ-class molecular chaperone
MYTQQAMHCEDCEGSGEKIDPAKMCKTCKGKKVKVEKKTLKVEVDKGAPHGE